MKIAMSNAKNGVKASESSIFLFAVPVFRSLFSQKVNGCGVEYLYIKQKEIFFAYRKSKKKYENNILYYRRVHFPFYKTTS